MIVMKFGGTSVQDAAAINRAAKIVSGRRGRSPIVVVSGMAGVTDTLLRLAVAAKERRFDEAVSDLEVLCARHTATAHELLVESQDAPQTLETVTHEIENRFCELENLIRSISTLGELTARTQDAIVSFGERLSSVIIAAAFRHRGIDTELGDWPRLILT